MNLHRISFGRLTVNDDREVVSVDKVRCICECGAEVLKEVGGLRGGRIKSCGCLRNFWQAHTTSYKGAFKHPLYPTWRGMHSRCYRKTDATFKFYGAKGVSVHPDWWDFSKFVLDVGVRPDGMSLDRVDSQGDYCRENFRWATDEQQGANKSSAFVVDYRGVSMTTAELSRLTGVTQPALVKRIRRLHNGSKPCCKTGKDRDLVLALLSARKLEEIKANST